MKESLQKMCRTCLRSGGMLVSLSLLEQSSSCTFADMLKKFATITITENDPLPKKVCSSCVIKIRRSYFFKIECESSQDILKHYVRVEEATEELTTSQTEQSQKQLSEDPKEIVSGKDMEGLTIIQALEIETRNQHKVIYKDLGKVEEATEKLTTSPTEQSQKQLPEDPKEIISGKDMEGLTIIQALEIETRNQHKVIYKDLAEILGQGEICVPEKLIQNDNISMEITKNGQETEPDHNLDEKLQDSSNDVDDYVDESGKQQIVKLHPEKCSNKFESVKEIDAHSGDCDNVQLVKGKVENNWRKCPHCPVYLGNTKNLEKHISKYHLNQSATGTTENDTSSDCDKDKDKMQLVKGKVVNNTQRKCPHCPDYLASTKNLEKHISKYHLKQSANGLTENDTSSTVDFTCRRCGAKFTKDKSLRLHIIRNKCTRPQFICQICEKIFLENKYLIEHLKAHENAFKCLRCESCFSSEEKLQEHNKNNHKGVLKNECRLCGKVFKSLSTLEAHFRTHNGETPFLCSICGLEFSLITSLKRHVMSHENHKSYECNHCGLFISKGKLMVHVQKHTGDRPFVCDICNARFKFFSMLEKHKRIHTGERPYACNLCPMRFTAIGSLKVHRRLHTGEKPFQCSICPLSFDRKPACTSHMENHTLEELKTDIKLLEKDKRKQPKRRLKK